VGEIPDVSAAAQALFDQALAIIKNTSVPANDRFREICKAARDAGCEDLGRQ